MILSSESDNKLQNLYSRSRTDAISEIANVLFTGSGELKEDWTKKWEIYGYIFQRRLVDPYPCDLYGPCDLCGQ